MRLATAGRTLNRQHAPVELTGEAAGGIDASLLRTAKPAGTRASRRMAQQQVAAGAGEAAGGAGVHAIVDHPLPQTHQGSAQK